MHFTKPEMRAYALGVLAADRARAKLVKDAKQRAALLKFIDQMIARVKSR